MKRFRIALLLLLSVSALCAAALLFSLVLASASGSSRQARLEKQAAMQAQQRELQELRRDHREWQELPAALQRFRRERIYSLDGYAAFRRDLNVCLDDNGFPAPSISLQSAGASGRLRRVSLQFTLDGPYRSLKKFIYDMERKPRMHFFQRIDMSSIADKVRCSFAMEVYFEE